MKFVSVMNRKMTALGFIAVGLSLFLVTQGTDVSAQQTLSNVSVNTTNTTTLSNTTNSTAGTTSNNNSVSSAFDQLKDTFGSLFGK
jgi:ABC-type glucose/galactose transport system permease subunit